MTDNSPIAWLALESGTSIHASDGTEIGKVSEVIADREKDIFSGITYKPGLLDKALFIPADRIDELTASSVKLSVDSSAVDSFEPYEA